MKDVDLQTFVTHGAAQVALSEHGIHIEAPGGKWHYAVSFPIAPCVAGKDEIAVKIDFVIRAGTLGFGLTVGLSRYVSGEISAKAGEQKTVTLLMDRDVDVSADPPVLVVRNWSDDPASGIVCRIAVCSAADLPPAEVKWARARRYPRWHYSFDLGDGVMVEAPPGLMAGHRLKNGIIKNLIDEFFNTSEIHTALDVACSSGFHTIELAKRGWKVRGIDINPGEIEQAKFVQENIASHLDLSHEVGDLLSYREQPYDLVHCAGLFYHLTDPVGGARKLLELCRYGVVVQSIVVAFEGDYMVLGDHTKHSCCYDGEFAFVPTAPMLAKIFKHVGFAEVHSFSGPERMPQSGFSNHAYFALKK